MAVRRGRKRIRSLKVRRARARAERKPLRGSNVPVEDMRFAMYEGAAVFSSNPKLRAMGRRAYKAGTGRSYRRDSRGRFA